MKLHKIIAASTKLFLDTLGFKSVWNIMDDNFVELIVLPPFTNLLKTIEQEIIKTGHVPYQLAFKFPSEGTWVKGEVSDKGVEKISFVGEVKEVKTFENISGDFHLIRYQDTEGNNYINKRYKLNNEILYGKVNVTCRPVAQLVGLKGQKVNLVNWAKSKKI